MRFNSATAFMMPIMLGAFLLFVGISTSGPSPPMNGWSSTAGVITLSEVSTGTDWVNGQQVPVYSPWVCYDYTVGGTPLSGSGVYYVDSSSQDISYANGVVERFRVGSTVTVYYDSSNVARTVLDRGDNPQIGGTMMLIGGVLVAGGATWGGVPGAEPGAREQGTFRHGFRRELGPAFLHRLRPGLVRAVPLLFVWIDGRHSAVPPEHRNHRRGRGDCHGWGLNIPSRAELVQK